MHIEININTNFPIFTVRLSPIVFALFASLLLFPALSNAVTNPDPCPGCDYTFITIRSHEDDSGMLTLDALLYTMDVKYFTSAAVIDNQWRNGDGYFNAEEFEADTDQSFAPLPNREIEFYKDDDRNGIVDPAIDTPLSCSPVMTADAPGTNQHGVASCTIDPAAEGLGDVSCDVVIASYTPDVAHAATERSSKSTHEVCGHFTIPLGSLATLMETQPFTCFPVFLIFGLLAGAMYAAGRSPIALFDISTPRLPRPKPYSMRKITIGTGGAMHRMALNRQLRLSQTLTGVAIRKIAKDLKKAGVPAHEVDAILRRMRMKKRPSNHEIAAALRLLAASYDPRTGRCSITGAQALATVKADARAAADVAKNRARSEMGDAEVELIGQLAYNQALRKMIHVGERGKGLFKGLRRNEHYANFRSLHDALWTEENVRRILAAAAIATGQHNWLKGVDIGGKIGDALDKKTGSNRFGKWGRTFNIAPRMADKGFIGAFAAGTIGKVKLIGDLTVKLVKDGIPTMVGLKRGKARAGRTADSYNNLKKGMEDERDVVIERIKRLLRYRNMSDKEIIHLVANVDDISKITDDALLSRVKAILEFKRQFGPIDPRRAKKIGSRLRRLLDKLESGTLTEAERRSIEAEIGRIVQASPEARVYMLRYLGSRLDALHAEAQTGKKSYSELLTLKKRIDLLCDQAVHLTTVTYDYTAPISGQIVNRQLSLFSAPLSNGEFNQLARNALLKHKIWELSTFAKEHGIDEATADQMMQDVTRAYEEHINDPTNSVKKRNFEQQFKRLFDAVLYKINDDRQAIANRGLGKNSEEFMMLEDTVARLSNITGKKFNIDLNNPITLDSSKSTSTFTNLSDIHAMLGGGEHAQVGHLYDIRPEGLDKLVKAQLERWSTHEMIRTMRLNVKESGTQAVLGDAAIALGIYKLNAVPANQRQAFLSQLSMALEHSIASKRITKDLKQFMQQAGVSLDYATIEKMVRQKCIDKFILRRRNAFVDELRQALIEARGREEFAPNVEGLHRAVRYIGGEMIDFGDLHKRLQRDAMALEAMHRRGLKSGGDVSVEQLVKGVWISSPDEGLIPYDPAVMKDPQGNVSFLVGGADKVINAKLDFDATTGQVKVKRAGGWLNSVGKRLDMLMFSTLDDFHKNQMEAKALLKYNKQTIRAMEHGPIPTLGIAGPQAATGAFAGEYSYLTERKVHLMMDAHELTKEIDEIKLEAKKQPRLPASLQTELVKKKQKLNEIYNQINDLDSKMTSANEARYHEAFFKFARHFREIDDTLTVGKTQKALTSSWGGAVYTDLIYNFGMSTPFSPFHAIRSRMPFGTPLSVALHPGWMIGKYFAERLRPYALLSSGMPAYGDVQDYNMRMQWTKALKSIIPFSPESTKFWDWKRMDFRDPKQYRAVDTDGDVWGSKGYHIMMQLKSHRQGLHDALEQARAAGDELAVKQLERALGKQDQLIKDEFEMLQKGYFRVIDEQNTKPDEATVMADDYRSIHLKYREQQTSMENDAFVKVDERGIIQSTELGKEMEADTSVMRVISPVYHRSIIGTAPVETLGDHWQTLGTLLSATPVTSWIAKIPITPAYYDFDSFEPDANRHGRSGFIGKHSAYHMPVGTVYGLTGALTVIPGVGDKLAHLVTHTPGFNKIASLTAPLSLDPSIWGGKAIYTGEYVEKGLTGASQMWAKWNATYEQLPLYRINEGQPVAGITFFSPYKYMDPNLILDLMGKYEYLVEPHEYVTAYPHLADELERNMNITELIYQRKSELGFFQRWSRAQVAGMFPGIGMLQALHMVPRMTPIPGGEKISYYLQEALEQYAFPLNVLVYKRPKQSTLAKEHQMLSTHALYPCRGCGTTVRGGQFCPNCGRYALRR